MTRDRGWLWVAAAVGVLGLVACGGNGGAGTPDGGGFDASTYDASLHDAPSRHDATGDGGFKLGKTDGSGTSKQPTCDAGCPKGTTCNRGICAPPQSACTANTECEDDSYCTGGHCVPYGAGPDAATNDPGCVDIPPAGVFAPTLFCEFAKAPTGDPFPQHLDVQATPIVVNFDGDGGTPSIIAPFTATVPGGYTETRGIVRILSGGDCSLTANLGGVPLVDGGAIAWVNSPSPVAVADLNGDGVAEIVVYMADYTTVAFTRSPSGKWVPLWPKVYATLADGLTPFVSTWQRGRAAGCGRNEHRHVVGAVDSRPRQRRRSRDHPRGVRHQGEHGPACAPRPPANYASYSVGISPVLADLYGDGSAELTNGAHVWKFDVKAKAWVDDPTYSKVDSGAGWAAIGDMNPYDGLHKPEIAVASGRQAHDLLARPLRLHEHVCPGPPLERRRHRDGWRPSDDRRFRQRRPPGSGACRERLVHGLRPRLPGNATARWQVC